MARLRLLAAAALAGLLLGSAAQATPILAFSDTGLSPGPFVLSRSGGTTSLTVVNDDIQITLIDALMATPFTAFLNMSGSSTTAASVSGTNFTQSFSGSYSITSGLGGTGTNFLSGLFIDSLSGKTGGRGLTLSASTPPANSVTMTSDVIAANQLGLDRALSFAVTDLLAPLAIINNTIASNAGVVAGNFSAQTPTQVTEPASLALLGAGLLAMVGFKMKQRRLGRS